MKRRLVAAACSVALSGGLVAFATAPAEAKTFKNCTELNKTYAHGVGKSGAKDKTSSTPVKNFKVSTTVYNQNKKSDRDKDGIACEKR